MKKALFSLIASVLVFSGPWVKALSTEERDFFGLTALESSHPAVDGSGYAVCISDTEFDTTHPGLGAVFTNGSYSYYFANTNPIPELPLQNPRVASAANRNLSYESYNYTHHGATFYSFRLPVDNNNTLSNKTWGLHGTAVAGTAGGSVPATNHPAQGQWSRGVAPGSRFVLASDSADYRLAAGQVPDGNPFKAVSMNRSFTGSSSLPVTARQNSGLITVNSAGNSFSTVSFPLATGGRSPQSSSIRWLQNREQDFIASGLSSVTSSNAYFSPYGSQRNQESVFSDYCFYTIRPGGEFDRLACGTSFSGPFTAGALVLLQQAFADSHTNTWLRHDQLRRIMFKSARVGDDPSTGLRYPVITMDNAVALAESYAGDPGFEPNWTYDFNSEPSPINREYQTAYPDPRYFRVDFGYTESNRIFNAPFVTNGLVAFQGNEGFGEFNMAFRNGWGDLAVADLSRLGKTLSVGMDFDTNPGLISGTTETFIGIKEMLGSDQFMDESRIQDHTEMGRVAVKITAWQGSDNSYIELLRCSEMPRMDGDLWARTNSWGQVPTWDALPVTTLNATNLTLGNMASIEVEFTRDNVKLLVDGQELMNVPHGVNTNVLTRATPYLHVRHNNTDHVTRFDNVALTTETTADPVVKLIGRRTRMLEGLEADAPAASGVVTVDRGISAASPLTVQYTVSGAAVNGTDFAALPGTITIPAGLASADLHLLPLNDAQDENPETIYIQLAPAAGYEVGPAGDDAVSLYLYDETDADDDTFSNAEEDLNTNGVYSDDDLDMDLLPNYLDDDDDGDSADTLAEDIDGNGDPSDDDTDSDGTANYLDTDDDGDGIPSRDEDANENGNLFDDDFDGDGIPDFLDADLVWTSVYNTITLPGTFNGWSPVSNSMTLYGHGEWEAVVPLQAASADFKIAANEDWIINWGESDQNDFSVPTSGYAEQGQGNIHIDGNLDGFYRFTFNEQTRAYSVEKVPDADTDGDGMTDAWEILYGLNPNDPGDAGLDPDGDGYTNLEEFQRGTNPNVFDQLLSSYTNMTVAGTFNGWDETLNNMELIADYTWQWIATFNNEAPGRFKFAADSAWVVNWGENDQGGQAMPISGYAEQTGGDIYFSETLSGVFAFTFNEQTREYSVEAYCDPFCQIVQGISEVVSPGAPGPLHGDTNAWKVIVGGDDDTSLPNSFAMARDMEDGRVFAMGHEGLLMDMDPLDNEQFIINVFDWLNDGGSKQVAVTHGHGEIFQLGHMTDLQTALIPEGYTFSSIASTVTALSLSSKDILVVANAWDDFGYLETRDIVDWVKGGGSLLMMGLGWSNPDFDHYPMNDLGDEFGITWLRDFISDPTDQYNGSPKFTGFYPQIANYTFEDITSIVSQVHTAYPTDLPNVLETNLEVRSEYLAAQAAFASITRDYPSYHYQRWNMKQWSYRELTNNMALFGKGVTHDKYTYPVMSFVRERFIRSAQDAYSTYNKQEIPNVLGLTGAHEAIWTNHQVYLMDNGLLDAAQLEAVQGILDAIPSYSTDLRSISVRDYLGTTTPAVSLNGKPGQVNIFGIDVGASTENPFPPDVAPRTSDVFSIVVAHEAMHVVDNYWVKMNNDLYARKTNLIARAGTNGVNYLRGGTGMPVDGYFVQNPQEFVASMANQWFTDSAQVFELGYARFTNGVAHPMDQALFFAEVISRGEPRLTLLSMGTDGLLERREVLILRGTNDAIRALSGDDVTWFFETDQDGFVTGVSRTDGTGDQDGDGLPDRWEALNEYDMFNPADAAEDRDADGLSTLEEYQGNTNPSYRDTDHDGEDDLVDAQPTIPAYQQIALNPTEFGHAYRSTYYWTYYGYVSNRAYWGGSSYQDNVGVIELDVSAIPDSAVIRNVAFVYDAFTYAYTYASNQVETELVRLDDGILASGTNFAQDAYLAVRSGVVVATASTTNAFPFGPRTSRAHSWGAPLAADLAANLGDDVWTLGIRPSTNDKYNAYASNLTVIVSYEVGTNYLSNYSSMTLASTMNGWDETDNNMVLVSNYVWRYQEPVSNVSGLRFKFAADHSWGVNWGDNDAPTQDLPFTGQVESVGGDININGILDGVLQVLFDEQTMQYSVQLIPVLDTDGDGMPDAWESANGLDPNDPSDAGLDPDGDGYTNLEEYENGTDPHVYDNRDSNYSAMTVAGTFNGWDQTLSNMVLVADYTWEYELDVTNAVNLQFKFAADGGWASNWGEDSQSQFDLPISGSANGGNNIIINGPVSGRLTFQFQENTLAYSVSFTPALDTDGDGMPDFWEDLHGLDKNDPADASLDPDGDGFSNLREYKNGTDPNVADPMTSIYDNMSVAGTLNGWDETADNMVLIDNNLWQFETMLNQPSGIEFKFAANLAWGANWGDNDPSGTTIPVSGYADSVGANIAVSGNMNGLYRITFNETNLAYTVEAVTVEDFDQDGMEDGWEGAYGLNDRDASDASGDADGDGLRNLDEFKQGSDPLLADTDGDGFSDVQEFIAGSDPRDAGDYLAAAFHLNQGSFVVNWKAESERVYDLFYCLDLPGNEWTAVSEAQGIAGYDGELVETITSLPEGVTLFFQVRVRKAN